MNQMIASTLGMLMFLMARSSRHLYAICKTKIESKYLDAYLAEVYGLLTI